MKNLKFYEQFEKIYVVDTNIFLTNAEYIKILSDGGANLVVIPETVLDEIDVKKSGFDEINFQAREFARLLSEDSIILDTESKENVTITNIQLKTNEIIQIVGKSKYDCLSESIEKHIINDRKIIEISLLCREFCDNVGKECVMLSNDIMMRIRAISKKLKTSFIGEKKDDVDFGRYLFERDIEFNIRDEITISKLEEELGEKIPDASWCFHFVNTITGLPFYGIRKNNLITQIEQKVIDKQMARPKNVEQKFFSSLILSELTDIIVVDGKAGTGKNYVSISSAMKLLDTRRDLYGSIIYIRKTVLSDDKQGEVGFLPGTLEEKMSGYLAPLYNTLENFVKDKNKDKKAKDFSREQIDEEINQLISKYCIETKYLGHMRGSTLSNAIVIIDEAQNMTQLDMQTTLSRMGRDVKVIVMGSNRQIDNPYVNKYNNGLSFLASMVGNPKNLEMNVHLAGCQLVKAVRSDIAEWTDEIF